MGRGRGYVAMDWRLNWIRFYCGSACLWLCDVFCLFGVMRCDAMISGCDLIIVDVIFSFECAQEAPSTLIMIQSSPPTLTLFGPNLNAITANAAANIEVSLIDVGRFKYARVQASRS